MILRADTPSDSSYYENQIYNARNDNIKVLEVALDDNIRTLSDEAWTVRSTRELYTIQSELVSALCEPIRVVVPGGGGGRDGK